ncbi:hypothetical protein J6590_097533, partial [Homalodisca vitripennis]
SQLQGQLSALNSEVESVRHQNTLQLMKQVVLTVTRTILILPELGFAKFYESLTAPTLEDRDHCKVMVGEPPSPVVSQKLKC